MAWSVASAAYLFALPFWLPFLFDSMEQTFLFAPAFVSLSWHRQAC